jgi:hypothetical protein
MIKNNGIIEKQKSPLYAGFFVVAQRWAVFSERDK